MTDPNKTAKTIDAVPKAVSTTTHTVWSEAACIGIMSRLSCPLEKDAEHLTPLLGPNLVVGMSKISSAPLSTVKRTLMKLDILAKHGHDNDEFIGVNGQRPSVELSTIPPSISHLCGGYSWIKHSKWKRTR